MSMSFSSKTQINYTNQEYRCPKCSLIPFIQINYKDNKIIMETKCLNNHIYSEPFDKMEKLCKFSPISNCICENCEEKDKKKLTNIFYYCSICYKFFCIKHGELHKLNAGHEIFLNKNLDSKCFEHNGPTVIGYCPNHNKNYCFKCSHFIENNKKIEEELNDEQIKKYENEIIKNENIIKEINNLFNDYKNIFKEFENNFSLYKNNIKKRIEFINEIINFYKNKKKENDTNYQMKANIENNYFDLTQTKKNLKNKLSEQINEMKEMINLLKNKEEKKRYKLNII